MLNKEENITDKVVWFCASCQRANPIDDYDCEGCNQVFTPECLVFNIETFRAAIPASQVLPEPKNEPSNPYFHDGGISYRKPKNFPRAVWED